MRSLLERLLRGRSSVVRADVPLVGLSVMPPSALEDEGRLVALALDPALGRFRDHAEMIPVARIDWKATFDRSAFEARHFHHDVSVKRPDGDIRHVFRVECDVRNPRRLEFIEPAWEVRPAGSRVPARTAGLYGDVVVSVRDEQALRLVQELPPVWVERERRRNLELLTRKREILVDWHDVRPLDLLLTQRRERAWLRALEERWSDGECLLAVGGVPRSIHACPEVDVATLVDPQGHA